MTTDRRPRRLTRQHPCKQSVRISAHGLEPRRGEGLLHRLVPLDTIFRDVLTGQRTSDLKKVDGNGESLDTPETQATPYPETPDAQEPPDESPAPAEPAMQDKPVTQDEPATDEPATTQAKPATPDEPPEPKARKGLSRRQALTVLGIGAGALIA